MKMKNTKNLKHAGMFLPPHSSVESLEERRFLSPSDLLFEAVRLRTFARWKGSHVSPRQLARAGFFYVGVEDHVECAICKGMLGCWSPGDNPEEQHLKHLPACPLASGSPTGNVPLEASDEREGRLYQIMYEYYLFRVKNMLLPGPGYEDPKTTRLSPRGSYPAHSQYTNTSSRIVSFAKWPLKASPSMSPSTLATSGFFYAGVADWVQCFSCGGGIYGWKEEDIPLAVHLRYYPSCSFARNEAERLGGEAASWIQGGSSTRAERESRPEDTELLLSHPIAKNLTEMGLDPTSIKSTFKKRLETHGNLWSTFPEALESVLEYVKKNEILHLATASFIRSGISSEGLQTDSPHPEHSGEHSLGTEKLKKLREEVWNLKTQVAMEEGRWLCRICQQARVAVVLQPCTHLHLCVDCARPRDTCPTCHVAIRGTIRPVIPF